jgi:hypothetical protein
VRYLNTSARHCGDAHARNPKSTPLEIAARARRRRDAGAVDPPMRARDPSMRAFERRETPSFTPKPIMDKKMTEKS